MPLVGQAEGDDGKSGALTLAEDCESVCLDENVGEVVGRVGDALHDGSEALLAQSGQNVVLRNDLGC